MEVPKCLCAEFKHTGKHLGGCPYYPRPDAKIRYEKAMTDSTKKCCVFCSEETLHDPTGWQGGCTDKGCKCHSSPDGGPKDLTGRKCADYSECKGHYGGKDGESIFFSHCDRCRPKSEDPFEKLKDNPHDAKYNSPEDLQGRLVKILRDKWGASFPEVAAEIAALLEGEKEKIYEEGCDEGFAATRMIWDRMDAWQKEWAAEKPQERALTFADALRLIEWKIAKESSDLKTRILERGPKDLEPENNVAKFHNALNEEWRKIITDI